MKLFGKMLIAEHEYNRLWQIAENVANASLWLSSFRDLDVVWAYIAGSDRRQIAAVRVDYARLRGTNEFGEPTLPAFSDVEAEGEYERQMNSGGKSWPGTDMESFIEGARFKNSQLAAAMAEIMSKYKSALQAQFEAEQSLRILRSQAEYALGATWKGDTLKARSILQEAIGKQGEMA